MDMQDMIRGGFTYKVEVLHNGVVDESQTEIIENLMPTEGLNYLINAGLLGASPLSVWYIAIFSGNYTPQPTDTAANIVANSTESSAYAEATRLVWTNGSVSAGAVDNSASVATFTSNATTTIYGGFITSVSTKGSGSGVLISAVRFASPKALDNSSVLKVTAGFVLTSS